MTPPCAHTQMDQLKASQRANSAAEQGKYRVEVERDRERAQRQKSKFSKGQIKAVRAVWRGRVACMCVCILWWGHHDTPPFASSIGC